MAEQTQLQQLEELMGVNPNEIITGDGVVLEVTPVGFIARAASIGIDLAAVVAVLWVLSATKVLSAFNFENRIISIVWAASLMVGLPTLVEQLTRGQSLGKRIMGLRVVRVDGGRVHPLQSIIRALAGIGELWLTFGIVAIITSLVSSTGRRVGDLLAGTLVITTKPPKDLAPLPQISQDMLLWARDADLAALPDGLSLACRQYLDRAPRLLPQQRQALGNYLYQAVQHHVQPAPPRQTSLEEYLSAVINERTLRDLEVAERSRTRQLRQRTEIQRIPFGLPS